jgi:hypothetical protein
MTVCMLSVRMWRMLLHVGWRALETAVKSLATVPFGDFGLCSTRHFYLAPTLLPTPNRKEMSWCRISKGPIEAESSNRKAIMRKEKCETMRDPGCA